MEGKGISEQLNIWRNESDGNKAEASKKQGNGRANVFVAALLTANKHSSCPGHYGYFYFHSK